VAADVIVDIHPREVRKAMIDFNGLDPMSFAPRHVHGDEPMDHFVEFYVDDRSLIESVRTFVSVGISQGDAAIVIADASHREALEEELDRIIELQAATEQGLYVPLDADETLSQLMIDGLPDPARFDLVIGELIERVSGDGRNVRVFGQMVSLLWAQGNTAAAFALEDLWNRCSGDHRFRLFCAYPSSAFNENDLHPLAAIWDRHSQIVVTKARGL
jgi:hypothetical protein